MRNPLQGEICGRRESLRLKFSYRIGSIWGIPIEVHITFLLLMAFVFLFSFPHLYNFELILLLFVFVVAHELSHSLVARHYKIKVRKIILYPIGGVSEIEEVQESPRIEWRVAVAGPLTSFGLGLLLLAAALVLPGPRPPLYSLLSLTTTGDIVFDLALMNIVLGAFNLLPAFPMDGGRVLRALLAERRKFTDATRTAANIGRLLGMLIAFIGIFYDFWLVLIGMFVYMGATEEAQATITSDALAGIRVRDVMYPAAGVVQPDVKLSDALESMFKARYHDIFVEKDGFLLGVVTWDEVKRFKPEERSLVRLGDLPIKQITFFADESILEAYKILAREKVSLVPVVERDLPSKVVGVVTTESIAYAQEKARYLS